MTMNVRRLVCVPMECVRTWMAAILAYVTLDIPWHRPHQAVSVLVSCPCLFTSDIVYTPK